MLLVILVNLMFLLGGLLDNVCPLLTTHLINLCFSLMGENQNAIKRLWRVSIRNLCKNLFFNSRGVFYFVIVKVLYILARILLFMVDLNILYDIIRSVMFLDSKLLELDNIHTMGKFKMCRFILAFALSWVEGGVCCASPSQVRPNNILF